MRVRGYDLLRVAEAARQIGISRQALTTAVRTRRIPAYCLLCGQQFGQEVLDGDIGHACPRDPGRRNRYHVGIRPRDVPRYKINRVSQASGRQAHHTDERKDA